jgi:twitching motility protein PilT
VLSQSLLPKKPEGLVAAYEMMVTTPAIQNLIRENKTYRIDSSIQTGRKEGMFLLDESLFKLWRDALVDKEEALSRANKPVELAGRMSQYEKGQYDDEDYDDEDEDDEDDDFDDDEDDDEDDRRRRTGIRRR